MNNTISIIASYGNKIIKINNVPCYELSVSDRKLIKKYLNFLEPCIHRTVYAISIDKIEFCNFWTISDKITGLAIVKGVRGSKSTAVNEAIEMIRNLCIKGNKPSKSDLKKIITKEILKEYTYGDSNIAA